MKLYHYLALFIGFCLGTATSVWILHDTALSGGLLGLYYRATTLVIVYGMQKLLEWGE